MDIKCTHIQINSNCYKFKPNLDCNYTFLVDLVLNGIQYGANSIGKV